jgi:phage terminase large subunit-like protein
MNTQENKNNKKIRTLENLGYDITHRTHSYALKVCAKKIIAGPDIRNACARHLDDLEKAGERGYYFCEETADKVFRFFEKVLKLNGGEFENKPFNLLNP